MKFKELRAKLKDTESKLNKANEIVYNQITEIATLNQLIELQSAQIKCMRQEKLVEEKAKNRLNLRLKIAQRSTNFFYKRWIKEIRKTRIQKIMLCISAIATTVFVIMFVVGAGKC